MAMPIYTEEARANFKICPLSINAPTSPSSFGCLGGGCMAWRYGSTNIKDPNNPNDTIRSDDTHGYCGLAGVPGVLMGPRA